MSDKNLSDIRDYEFFTKYMRQKTLSKRALLIAALSGFVLFTALFLFFIPKNSTQSGSASLIEQAITESPMRLKIAGIGVDAAVIPVGLTSDGAMDVPKGPAEVAWFNLGPRPGENGSAVITGHYGWKNKLPAVFDNLNKLRAGDKMSVKDEKGVVTTFVVREIRIYGKDDDASDVFISNDGKAHLNLITCTGTWNRSEKRFSNRLVIFTDKEYEI